MYSKLKKISKKSGEPKKKSQRKRRTLRKRKINRKSLKFGGAHLEVVNINSHLSKNEKNELKPKSGFWLNEVEEVPTPSNVNKKFLKYINPDDSKDLYLKDGYNCSSGRIYEPKIIRVLWVRHCYSCANDAESPTDWILNFGKMANQKMFREPLCKLTDKEEMIKLGKYLSYISNENIRFFSSFLLRAMETAKIISFGFANSKEKSGSFIKGVAFNNNGPIKRPNYLVSLSNNPIRRLNYVSEETKTYDRSQPNDVESSQSTTTAAKSSLHAIFLNNHLKGYDIDKEKIEDTKGLYGVDASEMANYYNKFLEKYILTNNTLLKGPDKLNVIVSHGGYIRMNISEPQQILESDEEPSQIKHPRNIECFPVEYTVDKEGQITCKRSDDNHSGDTSEPTVLNIHKGNEVPKVVSSPCNVSFKKDIKRLETVPDPFDRFKDEQL